jgi:hypothetical protein
VSLYKLVAWFASSVGLADPKANKDAWLWSMQQQEPCHLSGRNTDYNADKVNAILPAVLAYCMALPLLCTTCQPLGKATDSRKPSPVGVLQSCGAITKTLTSISEGNKQGKRSVFRNGGRCLKERKLLECHERE